MLGHSSPEAGPTGTKLNRMRRFLQKRPELTLVLSAAIFASYIVAYSLTHFHSLTPIRTLGAGYLAALFGGPTAEGQGPVFPVTWVASILSFGVALVLLRARTPLDWKRSVLISGSIPFAATGSFEITYQASGSILQPWAFHALYPFWILWTSIGLVGVGYFAPGRYFWLTFVSFLTGFLAWDLSGFSQVEWGPPSSYPIAYAFNIPLKIAAFALFLLLLHYGTAKLSGDSTIA